MSALLQQFDRTKYNVLVPDQSTTQVGPWHIQRVSEVTVNPDPNGGEIFEVGTRGFGDGAVKLYGLGKPALMHIAAAAGIVWNWNECRPESLSRDYVCYKAVGAIRLPDGSWQPFTARKEIDLQVIEEELRVQWGEKTELLITRGGLPKGEQPFYDHEWKTEKRGDDETRRCYLKIEARDRYLEEHVRAALIQWRKVKLQRAETGAMLRVIRLALGIKSQYTTGELKNPFIVPRIDFSPDFTDPEVRHALIEHGVRAMAGLVGQMAPGTPPMALPSGTRAPIEASRTQEDEIDAAGDGASAARQDEPPDETDENERQEPSTPAGESEDPSGSAVAGSGSPGQQPLLSAAARGASALDKRARKP